MAMFEESPAALLESVFARIHQERMAGLDLLNPRLSIAAVGFERHGDDWRGVLVTPWGIRLLLLPAVADWPVPAEHERAFRDYAAGTFAFLPNREAELGDYLACPLLHDVREIADHDTALLTARACLIALDMAPGQQVVPPPEVSTSRRRFLAIGR
jgi:[NiFe] hydrogenase assembly HybE family chaperone